MNNCALMPAAFWQAGITHLQTSLLRGVPFALLSDLPELLFTTFYVAIPDVERYPQALSGRIPGLAPISYVSPQHRSKFGPIYHHLYLATRLG